jgi:hypothetical protein
MMNAKVKLGMLTLTSQDDGTIEVDVGGSGARVEAFELDDALRRVMPSPFDIVGGPVMPRGVHMPRRRPGFIGAPFGVSTNEPHDEAFEAKLEPGQRKRIEVMPQVPVRGHRFELVGKTDPDAFRVCDLSIGVTRQLMTRGEPLPLAFLLNDLALEVAFPGVIIALEIENVSKTNQHFMVKLKGERLG